MAATNANPGDGLDFMLGVSQKTLGNLGKARDAIGMIADKVQRVYKGEQDVNDAILTQTEVIDANRRATERLVGAFSTIKRLAIWATGIYTVREALQGLFDTGERLDLLLQRNTVNFGSYTNALGAYSKYQSEIISGRLLGNAEDYMDAANILMREGVKMTDTMSTRLNDWAASVGGSVSQVASAIESAIGGNTAAFEQFGISSSTLRYMNMYTANTTQMRNAVLKFVASQKQFNGLAKEMPTTWASIAARMKAMKDKFIEAIIGRAGDPNSLNAMVKRTIMEVMDFLNRNAKTIKAVAAAISASLKWMFRQIASFTEWVIGKAQTGIDSLQKVVSNYKTRIAGFILYLELIKMRVLDFLRAHQDTIKTIIKWYLYYRVAKWALLIPTKIILSLVEYGEKLKGVYNILKWVSTGVYQFLAGFFGEMIRLGPVVARMLRMSTAGMWGFNAAAAANPIGLIVLAVAALVGWVVYLVTHWNDVQKSMQNVNGAVLVMASVLMPVVGLPLLMAKYWKQVKTIVFNLMQTIKNVFQIVVIASKNAFKFVIGAFKTLVNKMWEVLPGWLKDFGSFIYKSLVKVTRKIAQFFSNLVPQWLKDGIAWLGSSVTGFFDAVADGTKNLANKTAQLAEGLGGTGYYGQSTPASTGPQPGPTIVAAPTSRPIIAGFPNAMKPNSGNVTNIDQSIHIGEGAIPINAQGMTPEELQSGLMDAIKKQQRTQSLKGRQ